MYVFVGLWGITLDCSGPKRLHFVWVIMKCLLGYTCVGHALTVNNIFNTVLVHLIPGTGVFQVTAQFLWVELSPHENMCICESNLIELIKAITLLCISIHWPEKIHIFDLLLFNLPNIIQIRFVRECIYIISILIIRIYVLSHKWVFGCIDMHSTDKVLEVHVWH